MVIVSVLSCVGTVYPSAYIVLLTSDGVWGSTTAPLIYTFLSVVYPCVVESENVKRNGIVNVSMSEIYSKTYSWILSGTRILTVIFSMNLILTLTCYSKTQNSLTWNKSHAAFSSELDKTCPFLQLHHPSLFLVDQVA